MIDVPDINLLEQARNVVSNQLQNNQFLSGGLILSMMAAASYLLRPIPGKIWSRILRRFKYKVFFDQNDDFYLFFNRWLKDSKYKKNMRNVQVTTKEGKRNSRGSIIEDDDDDGYEFPDVVSGSSKKKKDKKSKYYLNEQQDHYMIWYKWVPMWITKSQEKLEQAQHTSNRLYNSYEIYGYFCKNKILKLVEEAMVYNDENLPTNTYEVYTQGSGGYWNWGGRIIGRSMKSVITSNNIKEDIREDINKFRNSEKWYYEKGIPYKRGYLLHGSPGSGKTSLIKALATELKLPIYYMNLSDSTISDNDLTKMMGELETPCILLIEDVDCIFQRRTNKTKSKLSFSGLLNAVDGVFSKTGILTFFTTNHIEQLDPALIRTGRVDRKFLVCRPEIEQVEEYFKIFYGEELGHIEHLTHMNKFSMSDLQEICLSNDTPEQAREKIKQFLELGKEVL